MSLGGLQGKVREGIFVKKLENPVGPFRSEELRSPKDDVHHYVGKLAVILNND